MPENQPSTLRPPPACYLISNLIPGERNKTSVILLRWIVSKNMGLRPLWLSNAYGPSGPQNNGFVSFAYAPALPSTPYYQRRAKMSSPLSSRRAAPSATSGPEPLVGHGINQGHFDSAMVQRPPHPVDIAVPLQ